MNRYIDIYCERLGPGLWAEPINALTNIAFFVAAFFALRLAQKENALNVQTGSLIVLIFAMGVGSSLFHTFATLWAMLADVLPILLFQISFIVVYSRYIIGLKWWKIGGLLAVFVILMQGAMQLPREWLNGTLEYAPAFIFLIGLGLYHLQNVARERYGLLLTAAVFFVSMTLRSIDMQVCEALPIGTHFLWHCFNGLVLYLSARAYILNVKIEK